MNRLLDVRGLGKSYGSIDVVDACDIHVNAGEFVSVVGRSGSGKSTLLYLLAGLERPDQGSIRFDGRDITGFNEEEWAVWRREHIGLVFQNFNLIPTLSAWENVAFPLYPLSMTDTDRKKRALAMLEEVGMEHRAGHRPHQLSGGEQQRVAIARALVNKPSLLLADEPTGNLDSATGDRIMQLFSRLQKDYKAALLVVTHDEERVAAKSDRRIRMEDGRTYEEDRLVEDESAF